MQNQIQFWPKFFQIRHKKENLLEQLKIKKRTMIKTTEDNAIYRHPLTAPPSGQNEKLKSKTKNEVQKCSRLK